MSKYIEKYNRIVNQLIKQSFPNLKGKRIIIKEKKASYRAHVSYLPWGMRIIVSDKLRKFPLKVIKRILIHELCHLEIFKDLGVIKTNLNYLTYLLFSRVRIRTEKEAIILMLKKGYVKEVVEARKNNLRRGMDYAISKEEIKSYMKKFKK